MIDIIANIALGISAVLGICAIAPTVLVVCMQWKDRDENA